MKFRNYCIVIMGNTLGVLNEIVKISETKPNILDAKGILIATFSSIAEPRELTDYFKLNDRNFLIFDLNAENSGYHITKSEINEGLFGFINNMTDDTLRKRTNELINEISSSTITNKSHLHNQSGGTKTHFDIEQQLQEAVDNEDYELAVKLRDSLKYSNKKGNKLT